MRKRENLRLFNFSESKLTILTREKVAFMRRDADAFLSFGLTQVDFALLETAVADFENTKTDLEALSSQTKVTADKEIKAEELRVLIRSLMSRISFKYGQNSATYRKFGTEDFAQKSDSELLLIAKRVVRAAEELLPDLNQYGVTTTMLNTIDTARDELEELLIEMKMKMGDREINQENRIAAGNSIYISLIRYVNTGKSIWETLDVAKYNDYVIYQ